MILNFTNSFTQRYDVGNNLDDKTVSLLSSKYFVSSKETRIKIFDELLSKCKLESKKIESCLSRYKYRGNTLGNYFLAGNLINLYIDYDAKNFQQSLSKSFFYGFSTLLAIVFLYILFILQNVKLEETIFVFVTFVVLTLTNPHILGLDFSILSSIFFTPLGDGYLPMIYVPRGPVSLLLIPLILSLIYNYKKLLIFTIFFSATIHLGYSLIFTLFSFGFSCISVIFFKEKKNITFLLLLIIIILILIMNFFSIYHFNFFENLNLKNLNLENLNLNLLTNINKFIYYFFLIMIAFLTSDIRLKKLTILIVLLGSFIKILTYLETSDIIIADQISNRMMGSFSYIFIAMTIFLILLILHKVIKNFPGMYNSKLQQNYKSFIFILFLFTFLKNIDYGYIKKRAFKDFSYKVTINNFKINSLKMRKEVEKDIDMHYDSNSIIDLSNIKLSEISDLNIDAEFEVLLFLYVNAKKLKS